MQTNPLYVSQLARHTKLPLIKTVQDHTEELFRHRTTAPSELHICHAAPCEGKRTVALSSGSTSQFQFERAEKSQERSSLEAVEVGALMGMVTSTIQCPGASWHPTEAPVPCRPSGASGTEVTCLDQLCWNN